MLQLELKNHPVWRDLTEILENLDGDRLVREHLTECDYKVCGYWDEQDRFYEEVVLPRDLVAELVSSMIGVTHAERTLKLNFLLKSVDNIAASNAQISQEIGKLMLVYDENLDFIDENWNLDCASPHLILRDKADC
jgi:hypothetical protein